MPKDAPKQNGTAPKKPKMIKVAEDIFGVPYLPGAEQTVIEEIHLILVENQETKDEHARLTKLLSEQKNSLKASAIKYVEYFTPSEANPDHMDYPCAGIVVQIDKTSKTEVSTRKENSAPKKSASEDDQDESPAPKKRGRGSKASADGVDVY